MRDQSYRWRKEYNAFKRRWTKVYQVAGIMSSLEEMFQYAPMPLMVEATLIPFRDVIITDGIVMPYNVIIGSGMARTFKDVYMSAKKNGEIVKSL